MKLLSKEQIEARFELQILGPMIQNFKESNQTLKLSQVARLWFSFLQICYDAKEINHHQHNSWVLSKKYIERFKP